MFEYHKSALDREEPVKIKTQDTGQHYAPSMYPRINCVVCDEPHTDLSYIHTERIDGKVTFHIGFPVCDEHTLADLKSGQTATLVLLEVDYAT